MLIRRRTFFGKRSDLELWQRADNARGSDYRIEIIERTAQEVGDPPDIPVALLRENCRDREMRMAATAELSRRERSRRG